MKKQIIKKWSNEELKTFTQIIDSLKIELNKTKQRYNNLLLKYFDGSIEFLTDQMPEMAEKEQDVLNRLNNGIAEVESIIDQGGYVIEIDTKEFESIWEDALQQYSLNMKKYKDILAKYNIER